MGNYSKLFGEVAVSRENYSLLKEKFNNALCEQGWEIKFEDLFIEDKKYSEDEDIRIRFLQFNPLCNTFKLMGYPNNFEEFFGIFRDNKELIEWINIIADVEDSSSFIFQYGEGEFDLKMFRTDEIQEFELYRTWHKDFLETIK